MGNIHIFEPIALFVLVIAILGRLMFFGSKISIIEKESLHRYVIYFSLFLIAIMVSIFSAFNQPLVIKAFLKWFEVLVLSIFVFLYVSDQSKFKKVYWVLWLSCFGNILIKKPCRMIF